VSDAVTLHALLADAALRRREFPVTGHKIFLAHAAVCPLPACVVRAISGYVERAAQAGQFEPLHYEMETRARQLAAQLLEATPQEIAFVPSTSAGLSLVAAGLPWRPGDRVVVAAGDFPANLYPWLNLRGKGVEVQMIQPLPSGQITPDMVLAHLNEQTRLVSLSSISYATGAPLDVDAIGKELHARGILFCLDAIQSLGAMPCSVKHVDFLAADAHKWLLGPSGIGVLFVRRALLDRLQPVLVGWKSVQDHKDFRTIQAGWADSARRYEPGSLNVLGVVGLAAALELLCSVGLSAITGRLLALRAQLLAGLLERGYLVAGNSSADCLTGILSFRRPDLETLRIRRRLEENNIVVSVRDDPRGNHCVRLSPHFYNTEAEMAEVLACL